jgi:tetratricopeptide (TPR) repeat protein
MERYIRLRPRDADPPASYGDVLLRTGRYEEALVQYRASLAIKPDYWYAYQRIGDIYAVLGRLTAAEEEYRRSFSLLPPESRSELRAVLLAGRLDLLRARYAEAEESFRKGLAIDSVSGDAAYGLSYALSKRKKFKEADALIKGIHAELEKRNLLASQAMASFHLMQALTLTERGEYTPALEAAREALVASVPVTRVPIYIQIAEIYRRMGQVEPAFDACEEALSLAPNMPEILLTLAKVYREKGDREMTQKLAMRLWKTWEEADPEFHHLAELRKLAPPPRPASRR